MSQRRSTSEILKMRSRREDGGNLKIIIKYSILAAVILFLSGVLTSVIVYFYLSKDLPKISSLTDYHPSIITEIYSDDNRKIAELYHERRVVVPLSEMPAMLIEAFIASEDARFYKHQGVDFFSIVRAFIKNLEAGEIVQGGSTITQQVTKSFFLTPERSYNRKIKEAILAYRIDKTFSKQEILYLYLNQIYLGHAAYGVEAASENYFGKSAKELNLAECAILAGLPQAPSRYSPFRFPEKAKQRQIYVLNRMVAEGYITNIQATKAINVQLDIQPRRNWYIEKVPFYTEHVRRYIEKKYGPEILYREGLKIYTCVNIEMQKIAREEIEKGLKALDKRQGYRGPLKHLRKEEIEAFSKELQIEFDETPIEKGNTVEGVVIKVDNKNDTTTIRMGNARGVIEIADMDWARKPNPEVPFREKAVKHPGRVLKEGDVILVKVKDKNKDSELWVKDKNKDSELWSLALEQVPKAEGALLSLEAGTGHVKAMIGGRDARETQFNRAIQSRRQPGSAFKPIIYAAAIDMGYTPATTIIDSPIVFKDEEQDLKWKPKNYGKKFYGPTLFRTALAKSRNVVTIKILQDIGIDYARDYARKLGITSNLSRDLSIALGSSGVSLLELVNAYSVFNNSGYLVEPVFITKIIDRDGNVLEESAPTKEKAIE
ncbi:MAG: PBP1A family penicillin-binding protein, partial [Deltaproteobacteria bacterium]|nr:PBP1A family penicillin-binding protein [Deltaproteobacteria bacterium]